MSDRTRTLRLFDEPRPVRIYDPLPPCPELGAINRLFHQWVVDGRRTVLEERRIRLVEPMPGIDVPATSWLEVEDMSCEGPNHHPREYVMVPSADWRRVGRGRRATPLAGGSASEAEARAALTPDVWYRDEDTNAPRIWVADLRRVRIRGARYSLAGLVDWPGTVVMGQALRRDLDEAALIVAAYRDALTRRSAPEVLLIDGSVSADTVRRQLWSCQAVNPDQVLRRPCYRAAWHQRAVDSAMKGLVDWLSEDDAAWERTSREAAR